MFPASKRIGGLAEEVGKGGYLGPVACVPGFKPFEVFLDMSEQSPSSHHL